MEDDSSGLGAFGKAVAVLTFFEAVPDRRQRAKMRYRLDEVLLLCLLVGAETVTDIALFGEKKLAILRRFRPFEDGTPAHDRLGDILASLDAGAFQRGFVAWVSSLTGAPTEVVAHDVIAIDGKTSRRSGGKRARPPPLHMVCAFAARQRLVLEQVAVADKSNAIVAIPNLLDTMAEGAVVTIDAMGCQRDIAQKILDKEDVNRRAEEKTARMTADRLRDNRIP